MTTEQHSTAMAVYERVQDLTSFIDTMGKQISKSKFLGCANDEQGQIVMLTCVCEGITPIEFGRTYHIIGNRLTKRADRMLAEFRGRGGKHKVVDRTEEIATVQFDFEGETYIESLTWEAARLEPFVYAKDGVSLKTNWATPRARRQMLWARAISEGVRTICPEIVAGIYTPEEARDFASDDEPRSTIDAMTLVTQVAEASTEPTPTPVESEIVDEPTPTQPAEPDDPNACTAEQRGAINRYFGKLDLSDQQRTAIIEKRGVSTLRELSALDAANLIGSLQKTTAEVVNQASGESRLPAETHAADVTAPVDQVTIDEIKVLLKDDRKSIATIKGLLARMKKGKIADLSFEDGRLLQAALERKQLTQYLADMLKKHDPTPF